MTSVSWLFTVLIPILLLIVAFGWSLSWIATRVDRLHARVEGARAALDAQLVRRASVALEVATSGRLDPASSVLLAEAAAEARECPPEERESRETDLTKALAAALDADAVSELRRDVVGRELADELAAACSRATLARRFHNEAVSSVRALRATRTVRWFSLAGHAAMPAPFEIDDAVPPLT